MNPKEDCTMQRISKVFWMLLLFGSALWAGDPARIFPNPKKIEWIGGTFRLKPGETIFVSETARPWIGKFLEALEGRLERKPDVQALGQETSGIRIGLFSDVPSILILRRPESYHLEITEKGILLAGSDRNGILYGIQTLIQVLPPPREPRAESDFLQLPCLRIEDWPSVPWRAIHTFPPSRGGIGRFQRFVDEVLVPHRFNVLVLEVNYDFPYKSHPEVSSPGARPREFYEDLVSFLKERGIRPIPQFNCLGHQSWSKNTAPLLKRHPEFDETPWLPKDNPGIYCRSWCPRHPEVHPFVFDLLGELIQVFQPEAVHLGMDEVFILGDEKCPRCAKVPKSELFRDTVKDFHEFLSKKGLGLLIWGDRLLEKSRFPYSKWESSENETAGAIDRIPQDIIICDWHYGGHPEYPSIPFFQEKAFRVLAASWKNPKSARAFYSHALSQQKGRFLGFLATTWIGSDQVVQAALDGKGDQTALGVLASVKLAGEMGWEGN